MSSWSNWSSAFVALVNLVAPPTCPGCHAPTPLEQAGALTPVLCVSCADGIARCGPQLCQTCGLPQPVALARCSACLPDPVFRRAWCLGALPPTPGGVDRPRDQWQGHSGRPHGEEEDLLRHLVHAMKFGGRRAVAIALGSILAEEAALIFPLSTYAAVVPVPLHPTRLVGRGYNQSYLLARAVARRHGVPIAPVLRRTRRTEAQSSLPLEQRRLNLVDSVDVLVGTRWQPGSQVLLVDDVLTTGWTARTCAAALMASGVDSVDVLCVARTLLAGGSQAPDNPGGLPSLWMGSAGHEGAAYTPRSNVLAGTHGNASMGLPIGIDLGTSNSVVSVIRDGQPLVIADEEGNHTHPSVVWFAWGDRVQGEGILVGNRARRQVVLAPDGAVFSAKRLIGRTIDSEEVRKARELVPYEIVEGPHRDLRIRVHRQVYPLAEISAYVLRYLKGLAESYLKEPVTQAVITVPAYFNDNQRQATRDAGRIAGLDVLRIVNEPTAAALAYGLGQSKDEHIAVYDLGGGTFDISVLKIMGDVFEVVSTAGDTYLGGDDFDAALVDHLMGQMQPSSQSAVKASAGARLRIRRAAEDAKKKLSTDHETVISIPTLFTDSSGKERNFKSKLSRIEYNQLVFPLVKRTFAVCDEAIRAAGLTPERITGVVMVGGMTRSLIIREAVESYFGRKPEAGVDPDEVVSVGAAIQAANLGLALSGNQGNGSLLIDVTPQSLGIATAGGFVETIIERNTAIPVGEASNFTTSWDDQSEVKIEVYQGEGRMASENEKLGEFVLENLPKAARGELKIEVSFDIDANGIVHVSAEDNMTRRAQSIRVEASAGLTDQEVEDLKFENREDSEGQEPAVLDESTQDDGGQEEISPA
ncbi:MAG TPA: hypothetical protein DIU15_13560 [Deltaproteobacteria bacterium]|nr:hypothetical protein [Deltaproteobacteria bacterium]